MMELNWPSASNARPPRRNPKYKLKYITHLLYIMLIPKRHEETQLQACFKNMSFVSHFTHYSLGVTNEMRIR